MALPLKTNYRNSLEGIRILVVEDEILIALDVSAMFTDAGAVVLGPCTSLADTLKLLERERPSAAMLDIRLGRETTEAAAAVLADRGVPFLFYSGQVLPESMRLRWPDRIVLPKPTDQRILVNAVIGLLKSGSRV